MVPSSTRTTPTPAERTRFVMESAGSLTLTTAGHSVELVGLHAVGPGGLLTITDPVDSRLRAEIACAPRGVLAAAVDFTDITPVATRERVRARLAFGGYLSVNDDREPDTLLFCPAQAALTEDGQVSPIRLDRLARAKADPLAGHEADLLGHLDAHHAETVTRLARLIPARHLIGVIRVRPVQLDRYGLVLRVEYRRGHHDCRLPFPRPAPHAGQAMQYVRDLIARSEACPRHRSSSRP